MALKKFIEHKLISKTVRIKHNKSFKEKKTAIIYGHNSDHITSLKNSKYTFFFLN